MRQLGAAKLGGEGRRRMSARRIAFVPRLARSVVIPLIVEPPLGTPSSSRATQVTLLRDRIDHLRAKVGLGAAQFDDRDMTDGGRLIRLTGPLGRPRSHRSSP